MNTTVNGLRYPTLDQQIQLTILDNADLNNNIENAVI